MKNCHHLYLFTLCALVLVVPFTASSYTGDDADFQSLVRKLDEAVALRNFQEAREIMEALMPLMKEELKEDKKILSDLRKEESPEQDPDEFQKKMERKTELYNALKKLVETSPAALRVKSESIKKDVREFISLT